MPPSCEHPTGASIAAGLFPQNASSRLSSGSSRLSTGSAHYAPGAPGYEEALRAFAEDFVL